MKIKHTIVLIIITCLIVFGCKKEIQKSTLPVQKENVSLAISGMTCEIGCAKTIASKLAKKEGVLDAKVTFKDSIATISYDANTTSKKKLIAFIDGIAGGNLYTATLNTDKNTHTCKQNCKKNCELHAAKKECCTKNEEGKMSCLKECKMACCTDKKS